MGRPARDRQRDPLLTGDPDDDLGGIRIVRPDLEMPRRPRAGHGAGGDERAPQVARPAARPGDDAPRRLGQRLERGREHADLVHQLEAVAALDAHEDAVAALEARLPERGDLRVGSQ